MSALSTQLLLPQQLTRRRGIQHLFGVPFLGNQLLLKPRYCTSVDWELVSAGLEDCQGVDDGFLARLLPCVFLLQVETEGDVATAFTLARILSNIPPSRGGPTSIVIFDIHALQVSASCQQLQWCCALERIFSGS